MGLFVDIVRSACNDASVTGYLVGDYVLDMIASDVTGIAYDDADCTLLVDGETDRVSACLGADGSAATVNGVQVTVKPLEEDIDDYLMSRSVTADSIAVALDTLEFVSPTRGVTDMEERVIEFQTNDPLRVIPASVVRGIRLSKRYGFRLGAALARTAVVYGDYVTCNSKIKQELDRAGDQLPEVMDACRAFRMLPDLHVL